jgi:heterodisulfide reductase subunit C
MILATKTLLQSLSAYCVSRCYPCQHCVARCHTGEFTTFVNKYQFSNFEVGHGRDKTLSRLSNCASNGSNI